MLVLEGEESGKEDGMSLKEGEERGKVGERKDEELRKDRKKGRKVKEIDKVESVENVKEKDIGMKMIENGREMLRRNLGLLKELGEEMLIGFGIGGIKGWVERMILSDIVRLEKVVLKKGKKIGLKLRKVLRMEVKRLIGGKLGKIDDRIDKRMEDIVEKNEGEENEILGKLMRLRLENKKRLRSKGKKKIEIGLRNLIDIRVKEILEIDIKKEREDDRKNERKERNGEGGRWRKNWKDVRVVLKIVMEKGNEEMSVVIVEVKEKREDRKVDKERKEGLVLDRKELKIEIEEGNIEGWIGILMIIEGKREEVMERIRLIGRKESWEKGGLEIGGEKREVRMKGNIEGLECERK